MAKKAAKREKALARWPFLVSVVVFAAAVLAGPSAEAARYLPSSLTAAAAPELPELRSFDVSYVDDDQFALFTAEDFSLLAANIEPHVLRTWSEFDGSAR